MSEPHIDLLDELGAEFKRIANEHEHRSHAVLPRLARLRPHSVAQTRAVALALSVALLAAGSYAVPVTRAAIDDLTHSFAAWVAGDEDQAPGRALRPEDDAPDWVRERGGRVIAEASGVKLYVTRTKSEDGQTVLRFDLGQGVGIASTIDGWTKRFDEHAIVVLGPTPFERDHLLDERGRFPLLGLTARSVRRVELRYGEGPPLSESGVEGGFVMMADPRRPLRQLVAYEASGREVENIDVSRLDMRYWCSRDEQRCQADQ